MQNKELRAIAESDSYFSYASGVASYIKDHYSVKGVKITIKKMIFKRGDLRIGGKGV